MLQIPHDQGFTFHDLEALFLRPTQVNHFRFSEGQKAEFRQHSESTVLEKAFLGTDNKGNVEPIYYIGKRA
jgi:hypothetical protein